LNKTEQVIGRAIRTCSHALLPEVKRNTTVYLYCAVYPDDERETADLYSYRMAYRKAVQVGRVSRVLKTHAIDCNLNHDAIVIKDQAPVTQIDSQRRERVDVNINDQPYTAICDWVEECDYKCKPEIKVSIEGSDDTTYSEYSAKWRLSELKERFRRLFATQPYYPYEYLWSQMFDDVPVIARAELFSNIVDNQFFEVEYKGKKGYIKYCNTYYVFQPKIYTDVHIPLAIRAARLPVRRDEYNPQSVGLEEAEVDIPEMTRSDLFDAEETWTSLKAWCRELATKVTFTDIPVPVLNRIKSMVKGEKEAKDKYTQVMDGIQWIHEGFFHSMKTPSSSLMNVFQKILLQFFWDNWFTLEEQKELAFSDETADQMIADETYTKLGSTTIRRFFNPDDGELVFLCGKDTQCSKAALDYMMKDAEDKAKYSITRSKTGEQYGFLSTDSKHRIVFKTNKMPKAGAELDRGAICAIGSNMVDKKNFVKRLGDILKMMGSIDLDLDDRIFMGTRPIRGATRLCLVTEFALRFMDAIRLNGQRWFYRPVSAFLSGHTPAGKKKVTKKVLPKAEVAASSASSKPTAATETETETTASTVKKLVRKKVASSSSSITVPVTSATGTSTKLVRKKKIGTIVTNNE